jgi:predicted nucleic acid-binding protein
LPLPDGFHARKGGSAVTGTVAQYPPELRLRRTGVRMAMANYLKKYILVPFDYDLCLKWAEVKADCEKRGHPIEDSDCWIAACALQYNCVLATNNAKHFQHVVGLNLISPNFN